MPEFRTAFTAPVAEGSVPAPPPPVAQSIEGDNFDETRGNRINRIWDIVAVYGPATDAVVRSHAPIISDNWREYARFHPEVGRSNLPSQAQLAVADNWAADHAIAQMLSRGWLVRRGDTLHLGPPPPSHTPFATMGGEQGMARTVAAKPNNEALALLRDKTNPMRIKPSPEGRARLKRELKQHGQVAPIIRWRTRSLNGFETFIVDGVTREELLLGLGVAEEDIWYEDLPTDLSPAEVLLKRISCEVAGTSKSDTDRNAYIAERAAAGATQVQIAKELGVSKQRVNKILTQSQLQLTLSQAPSDADYAEWRALSEAGWSIRDISRRTQWNRNTIQRYLAKGEEPDPEPTNNEAPFGPDTKAWALVEAAIRWGPATERNLLEWSGQDTASRSGQMVRKLLAQGYLTVAGKQGRSNLLVATDKARKLMPDVQPEPQPETAPPAKPKRKKRQPEPQPQPVTPLDDTVAARDELEQGLGRPISKEVIQLAAAVSRLEWLAIWEEAQKARVS